MKRTPLLRHTPLRTLKPLRAKKFGLRRTAHSTTPPSPVDQERFTAMRRIGCIACFINRQIGLASAALTNRNLEIHHQLSGGRRIGHHATVCLCHYHHQGKRLPYVEYGYSVQSQTFGPSLGREPRRFREVYGDDVRMLTMQNTLLARQANKQPIEGVLG